MRPSSLLGVVVSLGPADLEEPEGGGPPHPVGSRVATDSICVLGKKSSPQGFRPLAPRVRSTMTTRPDGPFLHGPHGVGESNL